MHTPGATPVFNENPCSADHDEMSGAERELADDAEWKRIQQNTFTRWANEHLKNARLYISSLETDLSDGLRLIALIEVLSDSKLPRHNKKPNFRSQKLENCSVALSFLQKHENIKIVNIDSSDVVDCKLKLILGLIWTLILHYSISLPQWEGDSDPDSDGKNQTPRQRLFKYIQNKIPDLPITNFTSDWNDGKAVGALVDTVAPGLCPDWPDWSPNNAVDNATEAMTLADDWLGIPQLITPEELVNPKCDELSMMTYLSQFPNAKLKEGAPLKPRSNSNKVRCFGPGLEPTGLTAASPTHFTIETFGAGKGHVQAFLQTPNGNVEPVDCKFNNDRSVTYTATYTPKYEGQHIISVKFGGKDVPKSPFRVHVEGVAGDAGKVTASGPGLEPKGLIINKPTHFDIFSKGAGRGNPDVIILDPNQQKDSIPVNIRAIADGVHRCEYITPFVGLHSVNVFYAGNPIPGNPFGVNAAPAFDASRVKASGRGLQPTGVRVSDSANFRVFTEGAGEGKANVRIIGPGGSAEPVQMQTIDEYITEYIYQPKKEGKYVVIITFADQEISKSPFEVEVGPHKESKIRVSGPGLKGGVKGYPAVFTVDTNGETGALGFKILGPSEAKIEFDDNQDGSADVKYYPNVEGDYAIHILCNDEDIPGSPYIANILAPTDYNPEKVICSGSGLEKDGVTVGEKASFKIDTSKAGEAPLDVQVINDDYKPVKVDFKKQPNGIYDVSYIPKNAGKHTVQVSYGGVAVPKSPFRVDVSKPTNPDAVRVFGPGVEPGVKSGVPTRFHIDCRDAGPGDVKIALTDNKNKDVPLEIEDNCDGTFSVDFNPSISGRHKLIILYDEAEIAHSPITINVEPAIDLSKVKIEGLEPKATVGCPQSFVVDASGTDKPDAEVACHIESPYGTHVKPTITPLGNGKHKVSYTPTHEGPHDLELSIDGVPIPAPPGPIEVRKKCEPTKCSAFGPGLQTGTVGTKNIFTVDTKDAGPGALGVGITGPSEAKMTCEDNNDGSCTVEYVPEASGEYEIAIKYEEQDIPGSPYKVKVGSNIESENVRIWGPGVDTDQVRSNQVMRFHVDASNVSRDDLPIDVNIETDSSPLTQRPEVIDNGDRTYDVTYVAPPTGTNLVARVTVDGNDVPGSPFECTVLPYYEPDGVKLSGPGVSPRGIPASLPTEFLIDPRDAGEGELEVKVKGPDGRNRPVELAENKDGTVTAIYVPDDCGKYKIFVNFGGEEISPCPIPVQVHATGKAENCHIQDGYTRSVTTGEEYCLSVDTTEGGEGDLTCSIRDSLGSDIPYDIEKIGNNKYNIYYKINEPGDYTVTLKYGGQPIPDGFYAIKAYTEGDHQEYKKVNGHHHLTSRPDSGLANSDYRVVEVLGVPLPSTGGHVTAEVIMPSGQKANPIISDNRDGTVSLKYDPKEEGLHELRVVYNGDPVQGSPFKFHVDSVSSGYVTAYGTGLVHGVSGEPCNFTVSTKNAGSGSSVLRGGLSLAIEGPSKTELNCHDNKDGTVSVNYLPISPGEYKVSVKFGDKHIRGSPYSVKITGEGRKRSQISMGNQSEVSFPGKVDEKEFKTLNASIKAPSGLEEPCFLKKLASGQLGISFTPREIGQHLVSIKKLGYNISGSPFKAVVSAKEVGDAHKVKISGRGLMEGVTHKDNDFQIDTKEAGFGGLSLSIEGPSKAEIKCKDKEDGTFGISYKPTEPGYYVANLKFADHHVRGSPFTIKVTGEGTSQVREKIQKQREAAPTAEVGAPCRLTVKLPGVNSFDLSASVLDPSNNVDAADMSEIEPGLFGVNFVPKESGIHTVSVKYQDGHIPGSPFRFTVGPFKDGGSHRVHCGGPGLSRGEINRSNEFNVWTREAGAGNLAISVEGPSKADIDFKDRGDGSCGVTYKVSKSGDYRVGIKFNDKHVPESPFKVFVTPELGEARKVEVGQFPEQGSIANKALNFIIMRNGAPRSGVIDCKVVGPDGKQDDCFMDRFDDDIHSVRFVPRDNGVHFVHVTYEGIHIPGSPIRLRIGKDDADPAAVEAEGVGLVDATSGQKMDFIINTCNAGTGKLAVTIDGPSKVAMDCTEVEEGYKVRYTPLVPGDYYISIKYNGHHIADSPYKVKCTGDAISDKSTVQESSSVVVETSDKSGQGKAQHVSVMPHFNSDVSKITTKGLGLKKAHLNRANNFSIDASNAGSNILYVGIYGPKSPCEEITVKHAGYSNYNIAYKIHESGNHIVVLKYGDDHVEGSPFVVPT